MLVRRTLSLVYGIARFVYQHGALNGLGFRGFAKAGGLCWLPPILTFPLLIGFGVDYEVFLLSRIVEFRTLRYTDRESVLLGLSKTGRIITYAGVIMAVAFVGLLPAYEHQLSQLRCVLLLDVCDFFRFAFPWRCDGWHGSSVLMVHRSTTK